ncbi:MAG: hypothetical protein EP344_03280 [Bacteroidetes bacterium]|nr:MAG: hypothetical protein EP344_03280 [Bacteroidota bacterium]
MKILKILLYIVVSLAVLWAVLGLFAKKEYHVERSLEIDAPRDLIYDHVRHFANFETWSPWAHLDPAMKTTIEGTDGAVGATYSWAGNDDVGSGEQSITALSPDRMDIEVHFKGWMESSFPTYMVLEPVGDKTKVTWSADMHIGFPWNALAMFTDMNAAIGKDYALGLERLKAVCEDMAHKKYRGYEIAEVAMPAKFYAGRRATVEFAQMPDYYSTNMPKTFELLQKAGVEMAGAPSGLYWSWDEEAGKTDMACAIPVATDKKIAGLDIIPLDSGQALVIEYFGIYDSIGNAHYAMDDYLLEKNLESIPPVIEEYLTDPTQEPDTSKWLTKVIYYVRPKTAATEVPGG